MGKETGNVQEKLPDQGNGLSELLSLFNTASGAFGSGTTTNTVTPNADAMRASNNLLAQIQSGANPDLLNQMANAIIDQANQKVAPAISESIGTGNRAYSDTTLQDSAARARAYASNAIAKANLDYIQESNKTAAALVNGQLTSSRTTTQVTGASPLGNALKYAGMALGGYSLYKGTTKDKKKVPGEGTPTPPANAVDALSESGPNSSATSEGALSRDIPEANAVTSSNVGDAAINGLDMTSSLTSDAAIADSFGGASDIATSFGESAGANAILDSAGIDTAIETASAEATADWGIASLAEDAAAAVSIVICTELMRQNILDKQLWQKGSWYNKNISIYTKVGYHYWAIPYVKLMRKKGIIGKIATEIVKPFAIGRYKYLSGTFNFFGMLTCKIGEPICTLIGKFISGKEQNWQQLYLVEKKQLEYKLWQMLLTL